MVTRADDEAPAQAPRIRLAPLRCRCGWDWLECGFYKPCGKCGRGEDDRPVRCPVCGSRDYRLLDRLPDALDLPDPDE